MQRSPILPDRRGYLLLSLTILSVVSLGQPTDHADDWPTYQHDNQHTGRSAATFDARTLQYAWTAPVGFHRPIVANDHVFAMSVPTPYVSIRSFRIEDGAVEWEHIGSYPSSGPMSYAEGLLIFWAGQVTNQLFVLDAGNWKR